MASFLSRKTSGGSNARDWRPFSDILCMTLLFQLFNGHPLILPRFQSMVDVLSGSMKLVGGHGFEVGECVEEFFHRSKFQEISLFRSAAQVWIRAG